MKLHRILIPIAVVATGIVTADGTVSAAPAKVGVETFTLTADINVPGGPVTAAGVINDTGVDIVVSDTQDTFDFGANGQITVFHSPLHTQAHFNEKKCEFSVTEKGTYVFGNGTGEWADYNGSGTYTVVAHATDACDESPVGTVTITARGPINLITDDD
jgi:hypothetical protein